MAEAPNAPVAVAMRGISKRFGDVVAVNDVSLDIHAGTVLGLLGENGAGKTTLMNVLTGVYLPDAGQVSVSGAPLAPGSPKAAVDAGVGMVHQDLRLVETLTGAENISLAVERRRFIRRRRLPEIVVELQDSLGFEVDLSARVWQLPLSQRQLLEILRVLACGTRVLILDEPTAVLSPLETRALFESIRRIARSGCAVVLISHKLEEVLGVADALAVLRAGRLVYEGQASGMGLGELARLMVGHRAVSTSERPAKQAGDVVLRVTDLVVESNVGAEVVHSVSFDVRRGELVAILGVAGNGQEELMEAIGGLRKPAAGRIELPSSSRDSGPGFGHIPAERLGVGLAPGLPVEDNALLGRHRSPPFGRWLRRRDVRAHAWEVLERLAVKHPGRGPIRNLSGGNLQRVLLGRELVKGIDFIIASYPTRGLDVGSAAQIRAALVDTVNRGGAVLLASEELDESLSLATRMLVMYRGRIVAQCTPDELSVERIGRLMTTGRQT
jgi:simple sugar transport system ATP-binding protein